MVYSMYLAPKIFGLHQAPFSTFGVGTTGNKFGVCKFLSSWLVVKLNGKEFLGLVLHRRSFQCMINVPWRTFTAQFTFNEPWSMDSCFSSILTYPHCRFCDHVWNDGLEVSSNLPSKTFDPFQEEGMSCYFILVILCKALRAHYVVYVT